MPNYNKSFNFRNGVQVDEDDLIVRGSLVGIGTTIPRRELDVYGDASVTGVTSSNIYSSGISTFNGTVHVGTGITIYANIGVISATTFYGDGSTLSNIPTATWTQTGAGNTTIYKEGAVGIATTAVAQSLTIGGRPDHGETGVGIDSTGTIRATGVITATSFVGAGDYITNLNANNITSGTLPAAAFPNYIAIAGIATINNADVVDLDVSGVGTVATLNSTTATVTNLSLTNANVTGVSTFNGTANFTGNIDVDGTTTLDNTAIAGNVDISGRLDVDQLRLDAATLSSTNTNGDITIAPNTGGTVKIHHGASPKFQTSGLGATVYGTLDSTQLNITGVSTFGDIKTGSAATVGFGATVHFGDNVKALFGVGTGDIQIYSDGSSGFIDSPGNDTLFIRNGTSGGSIKIQGNSGEESIIANHNGSVASYFNNLKRLETSGAGVTVTGETKTTNLNVTGIATVAQLELATNLVPDTDLGATVGSASKYFTSAFVGAINVGAATSNTITTRDAENLVLDSSGGTVQVNDILDVNGRADIDNVRIDGNSIDTVSGQLQLKSTEGTVEVNDNFEVTGVSTFTGAVQVNTSVVPDTDLGADLGGASKYFGTARVGAVNVGVGGTNLVTTRDANLRLDGATGLVTIDNDLVVTDGAVVTGIATFSNTTTFTGQIDANGGATIDNVRIGVADNNTIDTASGDLKLSAASGSSVQMTDVTVPQGTFLSGIATLGTGIQPNADKGAYLGTATKVFSEAHIDEVRIGVGATNEIDTREGNLILDAASNIVEVDATLQANGVTNLNGNVAASTNAFFVNSSNKRVGIGTAVPVQEFEVIKDSGNLDVEFISRTAQSRISIGQSVGVGNSSAAIGWVGKELKIENKDIGAINIDMGTSGLTPTSATKFNVRLGSSPLFTVAHTGFVGINRDDPTTELDVNGTIKAGQQTIVGVLTVGTGINQMVFGTGTANEFSGTLTGQVAATAGGISTFNNLSSTGLVSIGSTIVIAGISSFQDGVGIGTTANGYILDVYGNVRFAGNALVYGDSTSTLGVHTNAMMNDTRPIVDTEDNLSAIPYGAFQANRSSALMNNVIVVSSAARNDMKAVRPNDIRSLNDFNYQARVGINTHIPRTCLDVGVSKDPIILPTVTSSQANTYIIEPTKQTVMNLDKSTGLRRPIPGGLWFNETNNRAELGVAVDDTTAGIGMTGGVFCGIATLTQNNSGFAAYVPPKMTTANRNTMTGNAAFGGIPAGAIIYNTQTNKLQVYSGSGTTWHDLH